MSWLRQLFCRLWRDHANQSDAYQVGNRDVMHCLDCGKRFDLGKYFADLPSDT